MFHRHDWEVLEKTFSEPSRTVTRIEAGVFYHEESCATMDKLLFGFVTILLKCKRCQKMKKEELLGKTKECVKV